MRIAGLLMMVVVTAANLNDRKGATMVLEKLNQICDRFPRLSTIWVDRGYNGKAFILAILHTFYWCLQVVSLLRGKKALLFNKSSGWLSVHLLDFLAFAV